MSAPEIHAPDGGMFGHSLCQEPQGDVTDREQDVTCRDCQDELDDAAPALRVRLARRGFQFRGGPR